jgi:phage FluMu protein Com
MNSIKIKCPICKQDREIHGIVCNLPMWNSDTGKSDAENIDKVILIRCDECNTLLGAYKSTKE